MFVTNIFPAPLILQSNYSFAPDKSNYSSLESKILSQINYFRVNPKSYLNYYKNYFEENYIENIINNKNNPNKKLNPFKTKKEIALAGKDYLKYLIENNISKTYFDINKGNKAYFNLQQILSKYGQRKGKIFESVIINSNSASEIVNKLIKDEKAIKILLNPDMKYICITCGYIPEWKNICIIIDIIEDFIVYNSSKKNNKNNGIQILNEICLSENIANIEEKFEARTHKVNYEISRNPEEKLKYNCNTTEGKEKFKGIMPIHIPDINPLYYKTKSGNFHKSYSLNKIQNIKKSDNNKKEINRIINNIKEKYKNINTENNNNDNLNLLLNLNENVQLNNSKKKLIDKNSEKNVKQYKIITKNLNLKNIKINSNANLIKENKILNTDTNNEINNSSFKRDNIFISNTKYENNESNDNNDNTFQPFEQINDISNVNLNKKQNSFFSLDTEISTLLNPKKAESQENKFSFTPYKTIDNQEQFEQNINGFCLNDKEKFFKNNRKEIKNMIKLYNQERLEKMEKKKINKLRNNINNTEINEVTNTATFFYNNNNTNNKEKNYQQIYQKRVPTLSNSYKKNLKKESSFKGIKTKIYALPKKIIEKKPFQNDTSSQNKNNKNNLTLVTDSNIFFNNNNNNKKRIISFKANRKLYKNRSFENIKKSNNNNKIPNENKFDIPKEKKYLVINPILGKKYLETNSFNENNYVNEKIKKDNYKSKKKYIEEINIDLSTSNCNKSNFNVKYNTENNNYKNIYKKNKARDNKMINFNIYNNKIHNNIYTETSRKYKITNIGKINNNIQNTIKNKYIIINTQIK